MPRRPTVNSLDNLAHSMSKKLSHQEIGLLIGCLELKRQRRREEDRVAILNEASDIAKKAGFSVQQLFMDTPHSRRRRTIPARFINPKNPNETWTGRGLTPAWVKSNPTDALIAPSANREQARAQLRRIKQYA